MKSATTDVNRFKNEVEAVSEGERSCGSCGCCGSGRKAHWVALLAGVAAGAAVLTGVLSSMGMGPAPTGTAGLTLGLASGAMAVQQDGADRLVLSNGEVVTGTVIEETDSEVRFLLVVGTLKQEVTYAKSRVAKIERGVVKGGDEVPATVPAVRPGAGREGGASGLEEGAIATRVAVVTLTGETGRDISPTPLREAMRSLQRTQPDVVLVVIDNDWADESGEELPDEVGAANEIFITESLDPIFNEEIRQGWEKVPQRLVWVKTAMGGTSLLPFVFDEIYFHPEGRMGGMGNLSIMYGSTGDKVVREKLMSAFMGHAQGLAISGGYDPRLVRAMMQIEYVASYSLATGTPEIFERAPEPGEFWLTDNGFKEEEADDLWSRQSGDGNDVLTLKADLAVKLGVSRGTARSVEELLRLAGIERYELVEARGDEILADWNRNVDRAERELPKLFQEFQAIQVQGEWADRRRARSQKMRVIQEAIDLVKRYGEGMFGGSKEQIEQTVGELNTFMEQLKLEQLRDKR